MANLGGDRPALLPLGHPPLLGPEFSDRLSAGFPLEFKIFGFQQLLTHSGKSWHRRRSQMGPINCVCCISSERACIETTRHGRSEPFASRVDLS